MVTEKKVKPKSHSNCVAATLPAVWHLFKQVPLTREISRERGEGQLGVRGPQGAHGEVFWRPFPALIQENVTSSMVRSLGNVSSA